MTPRDARNRANARHLLTALAIVVAGVTLIILALAGVVTPPGWGP